MRIILLIGALIGYGYEAYYSYTHPELCQGLGVFNFYVSLTICWLCIYILSVGMWDMIRAKKIKTAEDNYKEYMKNDRTL